MKLYIVGGENNGWALDTDLRLLKEALAPHFTIVNRPEQADFIHSVSMPSDFQAWQCDRFVGVFPCNPKVAAEETPGLGKACKMHSVIAQSTQAKELLEDMGCEDVTLIPYVADLQQFVPLEDKAALRKEYDLPPEAFVIGSFVRDTEAKDLKSPKLVKGPDIFCDIVEQLGERIGKEKLLVLLAGPRRFWIRNRLTELQIPYRFVGEEVPEGTDDNGINILSANEINRLMNACDLMMVTSRNEGGPRAILEAASSRIPIISTPVGIAADILHPDCIFSQVEDGVNLAAEFYAGGAAEKKTGSETEPGETGAFEQYLCYAEEQVKHYCSPEAVGLRYLEFYKEKMETMGKASPVKTSLQLFGNRCKRFWSKHFR